MNEKEWLQSKEEYTHFDDTKIQSVLYFTLVWNIFEKELCSNSASIYKCPKKLAEKYCETIEERLIEECFQFLKNRYFDNNGQATNLFDKLFRESEKKYEDIASSVFSQNRATVLKKLEAILYIAFRIRNNLYHGMKAIDYLTEQNSLFSYVNNILMALIDTKRNHEPN
jgi:hypothetical protein